MANARHRVATKAVREDTERRHVILPYVHGMVRISTLQETERQWPGVQPFELDRDNPFAYADLISRMWRTGWTFVNVEQDIVPPHDSILGMLECDHVWCLHPYQVGGRISGPWMGLVKFAGRLCRNFPDVAQKAFYDRHTGQLTCPWQHVGSRLAEALRVEAFDPHYHWPTARHLHEYSSGTI